MSEPHDCLDCGEPATRETADGVWLCEGDYDLLCDMAYPEDDEPAAR